MDRKSFFINFFASLIKYFCVSNQSSVANVSANDTKIKYQLSAKSPKTRAPNCMLAHNISKKNMLLKVMERGTKMTISGRDPLGLGKGIPHEVREGGPHRLGLLFYLCLILFKIWPSRKWLIWPLDPASI